MKKPISNILIGVVGMSVAFCLWSCSAENPFENDAEGTIRLYTVVNAITTRSDDDQSATDPQQELKDKCVVYISGEKGLIYKKVGLHNVDQQITLKTGHYAAEAWTGDSVSASFDKKFFRGFESFEVTKGSQQNITLNCKIQNVVASINTTTINSNLMKDDYSISIKNSRGEIVFNKDNASSERAYFMMPDGDTTLEYFISGSRQDGKPFTKSGTIENVQRAHHYILNFEYNPSDNSQSSTNSGAVFLQIKIKDEDIHDSQNVTVHSRPTVTGVDCNIEKQLVYLTDNEIPESINLQLCGFKGLKELAVTSPSASELGIPADSINLFNADTNRLQPYKDAGLSWTNPEYKGTTDVATAYLTIPKSMIARLSTTKTSEHVIRITIKDGDIDPQTKSATVRIARNESAIIIEDPIVLDPIDKNNLMIVKAHSATLSFTLAEGAEGNPGVEYKKESEESWTFVPINSQAKAPRKVAMKAAPAKQYITILGLEAGTTYQYRACCGDFHSQDIMTFTTESIFEIPYANMETWNSFIIDGTDGCRLPGINADEFWGNGNPGSMSMGVLLTQESTDMCRSNSKSAKLRSQFVGLGGAVGKFAAGNLFAGTYVKTDGTDGILQFGRPYNGSHPKALRVWVNYRPGIVEKNPKDAPANTIEQNGLDEGQIFVALSTAPIEIRTKKANKKLFNKDDNEIIAYGQYSFEKVSYGADGQLQELIIPIEYNNKANTTTPTHIVIVCSASKYGDYFCGGEGSTMYVDDFELIYE